MPTSSNQPRSQRRFNEASLIAAVAWLLLATGCSDDGFGQRYPVSGKVSYKGELLKQGTINFIPNAPEGRAANGTIVGGDYNLTTFSPGDGVLPGSYKVSISASDVDASQAHAAAKAAGSAPDEVLIVKAVKKSKSLIPKKYTLPDTSGLTREVKAETNTFDFDLTD